VRSIACVVVGLALAAPAAAQPPAPRPPARTAAPPAPALSIRPFVVATEQSFAAIDTFDATLGKTYGPFFGGGVQVVIHDSFFVEASASRFRQTGERAYLSGGKTFKLGIPLTATITPLEVTGGYRFRLRHYPKLRPYLAIGVGSYSYQETSEFAAAGEDVDASHAGVVANGGAEFRLQRWVGLAVDVQYTHVPGIFGTGGVSQQAGETDLGGVAARVKLVLGR
jgi:outer membrane protein with beta-barrel domain